MSPRQLCNSGQNFTGSGPLPKFGRKCHGSVLGNITPGRSTWFTDQTPPREISRLLIEHDVLFMLVLILWATSGPCLLICPFIFAFFSIFFLYEYIELSRILDFLARMNSEKRAITRKRPFRMHQGDTDYDCNHNVMTSFIVGGGVNGNRHRQWTACRPRLESTALRKMNDLGFGDVIQQQQALFTADAVLTWNTNEFRPGAQSTGRARVSLRILPTKSCGAHALSFATPVALRPAWMFAQGCFCNDIWPSGKFSGSQIHPF